MPDNQTQAAAFTQDEVSSSDGNEFGKITLTVKNGTSVVPDNQTQTVTSTQDEVSSSGGKKEATTESGVPQTQAQVFVTSLGGKKATELKNLR